VAGPLGVNRSFSGSRQKFRKNRTLCRTLLWKLGKPGFPRRRRKAADISELGDFEKFFKDLRPGELFVVVPAPSGGGYLVAGLLGVNRSFSGPWPIPGKPGSSSQTPPRPPEESKLSGRPWQDSQPLGTSAASSGLSRTCVPGDPFVAARFRAEAAIYWRPRPPSTGCRKESQKPSECRTSNAHVPHG
jgi:hypothetical protein